MKKIIVFTIVSLIFVLPLISHASAIDDARSVLNEVGNNVFGSGESDISVIVGRVIAVVLSVIGVIFTALIIYGGFLYMTAAGNQEQVARARTLIRDAAIGLAIVITAFAITNMVVFGLLGATTN